MLTPFLYRRSGGFYARFWVPKDLQPLTRSRFIVRALGTADPVIARYLAAVLAMRLSSLFNQIKQGYGMDLDEALKALNTANGNRPKEWQADRIQTRSGAVLENVRVDSKEDASALAQFINDADSADEIGRVLPDRPTQPAHRGPVYMLADRAEAFLQGFAQSGRSDGNAMDTSHSLRLFVALTGDKPLHDVSGDDCRAFIASMEIWPKHATKRFRDKTPREILANAKANPSTDTAAPRTIEKHRDAVRKFFNWAVNDEEILTKNPMNGLKGLTKKTSDEQTKLPFSNEDLAVLFEPARFGTFIADDDPAKRWGPLLALYTGARLGEIAQLYVDDIEQVAGIWGVHFRDLRPDQSLKNMGSLRFVPIHSELINAGFIDYVQDIINLNREHASQEANITRAKKKQPKVEPIQRLFPELTNAKRGGYGDGMSDKFMRYQRGECQIKDKQKTFHCFRHTLTNHLDKAATDLLKIGSITGHTHNDVLSRVYIQPATLPERQAAIEKLAYGLTLPIYQPGSLDKHLTGLLLNPKPAKAKAATP
jgi:integrase